MIPRSPVGTQKKAGIGTKPCRLYKAYLVIHSVFFLGIGVGTDMVFALFVVSFDRDGQKH